MRDRENKLSYAELDRLYARPLDDPFEKEMNSFTSYTKDAIRSYNGSKVIRGDYLDKLVEENKTRKKNNIF